MRFRLAWIRARHARDGKANPIFVTLLVIVALLLVGVLSRSERRSDFSSPETGNTPQAKMEAHLVSARDVFEVSIVDAAKKDGYTVTSAVCEAVAPIGYRQDIEAFNGQLVFFAFRLRPSSTKPELLVL